MPLTPIDKADLDPRLLAVLEPGETVLWQDVPKPGSLPPPMTMLGALALVAVGAALALDLVGFPVPQMARLVAAAAAVGVGATLIVQGWQRRASRWIYAITDRRLISVLGQKLVRSMPPEALDRLKLMIAGDTVYWFRQPNTRRMRNDPQTSPGLDGRLIGFHGQTDPEATRARIQDWRAQMSARATEQARDFAATMVDPVAESVPKGVLRVVHARTGLRIDVPESWQVNVRSYRDGPLRLFGVTLLPKVIREGPERAYDGGSDWNALSIKGAPEAGLDLVIHDRVLDTDLAQVTQDKWAGLTGMEIIQAEQDLRIGPFRGFGATRRLPSGFEIKGQPALSGPVMMRQVWLESGGMSLEIKGFALESQPEIQRGIDAMIASIRLET